MDGDLGDRADAGDDRTAAGDQRHLILRLPPALKLRRPNSGSVSISAQPLASYRLD